jgi:hypothetical protein
VALKARGDDAMRALRFDDALAAYRKAYDLSHDSALLYNEARACEGLGNYAAALDLLDRFDAEAPAAVKSRVPDLAGLRTELSGKVATLVVTCDVAGAEVRLNDRVIGVTPLPGPIKTTAGHVTVVVRADRYEPARRDADLRAGETFTFASKLTPRDLSAVLMVRSNASGATVTMDGVVRGGVPVEIKAPAGSHELRLEQSGYETKVTSIVLDAGQHKELEVPLVKTPSIFGRWWFWTAVGVGVAGGVATYFVVTSQRSPDRGTVPPGVISGP